MKSEHHVYEIEMFELIFFSCWLCVHTLVNLVFFWCIYVACVSNWINIAIIELLWYPINVWILVYGKTLSLTLGGVANFLWSILLSLCTNVVLNVWLMCELFEDGSIHFLLRPIAWSLLITFNYLTVNAALRSNNSLLMPGWIWSNYAKPWCSVLLESQLLLVVFAYAYVCYYACQVCCQVIRSQWVLKCS